MTTAKRLSELFYAKKNSLGRFSRFQSGQKKKQLYDEMQIKM